MQLRCAWCGTSIANDVSHGGDEVSHGICLSCTEEMLRQAREEVDGAWYVTSNKDSKLARSSSGRCDAHRS